MFALIALGIAAAAGIGGFATSRDFTRRKLRYVDAAHTRPAPWIAAGVAAAVVAPFTLLPLIGLGTVIAGAAGVGLGVKSAQRDRNLLE